MCAVRAPETGRVIRVGVLQEGKIILERRLDPGESLTVGNSPRAVVSHPLPSLPRRTVLIEAHRGRYRLRVPPRLQGKVSHGGELISLDQLRERPPSGRDLWLLPLGDSDRGSVRLGDLTLLFQLVQAPLVAQRELRRQSFRPRLLNDDDPVFMGFLGLFTVMASAFAAYTSSVVTPELIGDFSEVERFAQVYLPPPDLEDPPPVEPEPVTRDDALVRSGPAEPVPTEEPAEAVAANDAPPERPLTAEEAMAREIAARQALEERVYAESAVLQWLTTHGEAVNGLVVSPDVAWGEDMNIGGDPDLDKITELAPGFKGGAGGGTSREDVGITVDKLGVGRTGISDAGAAKPEIKLRPETPIMPEGGADADRVMATVRGYYPRIKTCYERRLKEVPGLQGRLEIEWVVHRGQALDVRVLDNSTDDRLLQECIVDSMRTWRFDGDIMDFPLSFPFVLSPG